jgi:hypothetical protein
MCFILNVMFNYVCVWPMKIRKEPNDFTMVTRGYWEDVRLLARRSPAAFQTFVLLTERMNKTNAVVISQTTMCQILGYGRTTIHSAVKLLESERWLQVVKIGTANGYIINSKVVWRDHSGKRYGSFYAEVVVSEAEQGRMVEDWDNIELRHVPILQKGDTIIDDGADLPPPDQKGFLPPDLAEFPRVLEKESDAKERSKLEKLGQKRLLEN